MSCKTILTLQMSKVKVFPYLTRWFSNNSMSISKWHSLTTRVCMRSTLIMRTWSEVCPMRNQIRIWSKMIKLIRLIKLLNPSKIWLSKRTRISFTYRKHRLAWTRILWSLASPWVTRSRAKISEKVLIIIYLRPH